MITGSMETFATLMAVAALVYWLSGLSRTQRAFTVLPPVIWLYFLPMMLSNFGVLSPFDPVHQWMASYLLPVALFMLAASVSTSSLMRVGRVAAIMLVGGSLGVTLGCVTAYALFSSSLPTEGGQGLAVFGAGWTGGPANMLALQQQLDTDPALLYGVLGISKVIGLGWLGLLLVVSAYQVRIDRWLSADRGLLDQLASNSGPEPASQSTRGTMILLAGAFSLCIFLRGIAENLPAVGEPVIVTSSALTVVFVVVLGLLLGRRRAQSFRRAGAPHLGYALLLMLVTSVGAQANWDGLAMAPEYLLAGLVALVVHIVLMLALAYLMKAPSFFVAVGSMANIGGAVTAPIAAAAYQPVLAPVAALMGVAGYIVGMYAPLLVVAVIG